MDRRHVIGGGLAAGVAGLAGGAPAGAAQRSDDDVARAVDRLGGVVDSRFAYSEPGPIVGLHALRQQQQTFLRANHKYPDFIEVGYEIWESVYFWHIEHRQPLQVGRFDDGRYTIAFMFTLLIMRPDVEPRHIGPGIDRSPTR